MELTPPPPTPKKNKKKKKNTGAAFVAFPALNFYSLTLFHFVFLPRYVTK